MEHIRTGRIQGNPQVLLRPSPADDGQRYAEVRRDYPELIYCQAFLGTLALRWLARKFPLSRRCGNVGECHTTLRSQYQLWVHHDP